MPEDKNEEKNINVPAYYSDRSAETIEAIIEGLPAAKAVCLANILKYAIRAEHKGQYESDVNKANNYAHRLVTGEWRPY